MKKILFAALFLMLSVSVIAVPGYQPCHTFSSDREEACSSLPRRLSWICSINGKGTCLSMERETTLSMEAPRAQIESVWDEFDVYEDGRRGMRIHVRFYIYNHQGRPADCNAYFYYEDGGPLKDFDGDYLTTSGNVVVGETFTPSYESSIYKDFTLFMPYGELHLGEGSFDLKYCVDIYSSSGSLLSNSKWRYFTLTD